MRRGFGDEFGALVQTALGLGGGGPARKAFGAEPIGKAGCPGCGVWIAWIESVRIVLIGGVGRSVVIGERKLA